jgi:large subunit ribosomal protein L7/L12
MVQNEPFGYHRALANRSYLKMAKEETKEEQAKEQKKEETAQTKEATEWSKDTKSLGDKIVSLTLMQAKELADYLKEVHGIEPAAGGAVMMAGPAAGAGEGEEEEKSTFDVILKEYGDKKIQVIKEVRAITSLGLKEAKDLVDNVPKPVKEGLSKEEAETIQKQLEATGAVVELA